MTAVLEFDADTHTYRLGGSTLPSVTEVLRPLESFAKVPPDALEYAGARGAYVHEAMALLVRDDLDWQSLAPEWLPYIRAGQNFLSDSGITVTGSELRVFSARLRVAGTIDLVGVWRKADALIDFKATSAVPATVGPQTAGYELLHRHQFSRSRKFRRFCVHLKPAGYRVIPLDDSRDESIFVSALNLYHWWNRYDHAVAA